MRRGNNPEFIFDDNGSFVGICLGSDFTAEHEWGIKGIKETLGIPQDNTKKKNFGVKGRMVTTFPERNFCFKKIGNYHYLLFAKYEPYHGEWDRRLKSRELESYKEQELTAAWSGEDFGIRVSNEKANFLKDLFDAFKKKDIAFGVGPREAFKNGGLMIMIASRIPKNIDVETQASDAKYRRLLNAANPIIKELENAGKKKYSEYTSLSPKWVDEKDESKGIIFWFNPTDSENNNDGWFTIKDLRDWIIGKGKIPKKPK